MRRYTLEVNGKCYVIDVEELAADQFRVQLDGRIVEVRLEDNQDLVQAVISPDMASSRMPTRALSPSGLPTELPHTPEPRGPDGNRPPPAARQLVTAPPRPARGDGRSTLTAPMPGVIVSVEVAPGATVTRGQVLVVLEAMKMKNSIKSSRDGVVAEVFVQPEQPVGHGDALLSFQEGQDEH